MNAKRWMTGPVRLVVASVAMIVAGCGGGGSSSPIGASAPAIDPGTLGQDAAAPTGPAALSQFLTLDPATPANYETELPAHFEAAVANDNTPKLASATASPNDTITLGRVLFHDKNLSINSTVSCASCHQQVTAFADTKRFSVGFSGVDTTTRHAMRLANLRFYKPATMFWDKRAASLEAQSLMPLQNPVEMGFDEAHGGLAALTERMKALPYYPELFRLAFADATISPDRMQTALSQFMRRIVSVNSRWDAGYAKVFDAGLPDKGVKLDIPDFTAQENRGRHLFMAPQAQGGLNCAACHVPPSFALAGAGGNGLDAGETVGFKSPSLKDVAKSSAFMHDGRFASLDEVVEHYNSGVKDGPALDKRLKDVDGKPLVLNLPEEDKAALVAFLKTLSDPVLAANPVFANPFRQ